MFTSRMPTQYRKSAQTGEGGVALVRKLVTDAGGIFRPFESTDLGIDAAIELLTTQREPSGDLVLVQIKAGKSYIRSGHFYLDADKDHFETWVRYALPVVGIVCNPDTGEARWVDVSDHLRQHPDSVLNGPYSVKAPANQLFSPGGFELFLKHFRRNPTSATQVDVTPNLLIRPWEPADAKATRILLNSIATDYPAFDKWLAKKFADPSASKKVVEIGNVIAAFSMWQRKDERNVKLQTFIVSPLFRGTAIGQHLLYHELRTWALDGTTARVHVTVASSKSDLIAYFRMFGFRVEGFSPQRYPRPAAELVMAKHFFRDVVRTPAQLQSFAQRLYDQLWGLDASGSRFGVDATDLAVPATLPILTMTVDSTTSTTAARILLMDPSGQAVLSHGDESLMREFYPLRLHLNGKRYVGIPIYPVWVDAMLSTSGPHTPLKLRVDHVYYCFPKIKALSAGDLVIFYETKTGGGRGAAIGAAVVQAVAIDSPANLFQNYSDLGIYALPQIERHTNAAGLAMAIRFSLFESFSEPVLLARIRQHLGQQTTFQGLTPLTRDAFEAIRTEGVREL